VKLLSLKKFKSRKSTKWHRALKAEKKKQLPAESVNIENIHLFSNEKLKNKLRNPKNNIKITGKKLRRLTKRLGHSLKEKLKMDFEVADTRQKPGRVNEVKEVKMTEIDAETATTSADITSATLTTPSSSKKKRRGGKKHKKKQPSGEKAEGTIFENDDEWEDIEMGDG